MDARIHYLDAMGPRDHAFLLYESGAERDQLLSQHLQHKAGKRNCVCVLSESLGRQIKSISKTKGRSSAVKDISLTVSRAADAFQKEPPHQYAPRKIKEMQQMVKSGECAQWLLIGDWVHMYYNRPMEILKTELALDPRSGRIICCYRASGFSETRIDILAKLIDLHSHVLFSPRSILVRN